MIKRVAFALVLLVGIAGCHHGVGGVVGDGNGTHCEQHRVSPDGHMYVYLLPECVPDEDQGDMAQGASTSDNTVADMGTDTSNGADMSTSGSTSDMTGGFNGDGSDGGYGDCTNIVCPSGETCNAGQCIPVTVCDPSDPACWHNGACLPVELSYMTTMCKVPPGNTGGQHEICVGNAAVSTQEGIGSYVGFCP